ncbi:unnamed protein product [Bursaphelenchus okinawaensis]|uniref:RRM domain-containing protein n=1 Tax=Bursaphelenchus okinawaensis TaxID=465554 RepID=A0A811JS30_9BILA|nr:unnamed protein product [Bursaphelenchus okinawaensis]CAG9080406.1 unnamed protein product [Bursaphelenchus okinawaensis]
MTDVEMADNGNTTEEVKVPFEGTTQEHLTKVCTEKKVNSDVAKALSELFEALNLTLEDFDERVIEALANFPVEHGKFIISEIKKSELFGVQNRPQFLMSVMRNFKDKVRQVGGSEATKTSLIPGPSVESLKKLIADTGYSLEVTVGQRKFHAPADVAAPTHGHETFIGQIPKELFEDKVFEKFQEIGKIYDIRLMLDPIMGRSRGYAFLVYLQKEHAHEAAKKFDGHDIIPGKPLKVNVSVANRRLFVGNIPKSKSKEDILEELKKHPELENVTDVIIYSFPDATENKKNRGFCFVDFADHKSASDARRKLSGGKVRVRPFNSDLVVDWAEQQAEPDEQTMSQVKVLYVKNLKEAVTDERLNELFKEYGKIERVKKIKDYAFIHYEERESAIKALEAMNGTKIDDVEVDISLAKPQGDNKMKKKTFPNKFPGPPGKKGGIPGAFGPKRGGASARGSYGGPPYGSFPPAPGYDPYYGAAAPAQGYYQGGYDPYYQAQDPYYGAAAGGYPPSGYGTAYGGMPAGFKGRPPMRGGGMKGRGGKRPGGSFDGPAVKRGGRALEDFSSDVAPSHF